MADAPGDVSEPAPVEGLEDATVRTVDELNEAIAGVLEDAPDLYFDYVVGEVTDYRDVNGNVHFDLDFAEASIHCVVFGFRRGGTVDDLESGTQVAVAGDLSYYEARGSCSILVTDVVEIGEGSYRQELERHRQALAEDGLFADEHKQALPALPGTVGIVTSADSDAREDAVTSIHERHPDVDVVVHHATVQGDAALPALLEAVSALDRNPAVDVIVVTRGGGADTTLRVFNEPALCRVIFETDTPVVVGVGHERDRTLAAEVADERVMTPTHVGSIVPEKAALREEHATVVESLEGAYRDHATRRLAETDRLLDEAYVARAETVFRGLANDLDHAMASLARERLTALEGRLDHGLAAVEQRAAHEREKAAATAEVEATYERRQRVQRAVIAVLLVLLLLLGTYVLLTL